jgi:hypothetical protein
MISTHRVPVMIQKSKLDVNSFVALRWYFVLLHLNSLGQSEAIDKGLALLRLSFGITKTVVVTVW